MPHALELPRMLRAVIELVSGQRFARFRGSVVHELVALRLRRSFWCGPLAGRSSRLRPRFAAIIGALDDLAKPATGLGCEQPIRIGRRSLNVIDLPARKVRTAHVPLVSLAVRIQHKGTFARADQHTNSAHQWLPFLPRSEEHTSELQSPV